MAKKPSFLTTKRLAWSAVAACVGCCTIPVVALAIGFTSIAGLGVYFEQAATGFFVAALSLFLYGVYRKRPQACSMDCSCKRATASPTEKP